MTDSVILVRDGRDDSADSYDEGKARAVREIDTWRNLPS